MDKPGHSPNSLEGVKVEKVVSLVDVPKDENRYTSNTKERDGHAHDRDTASFLVRETR
jgi:hypothetical protein